MAIGSHARERMRGNEWVIFDSGEIGLFACSAAGACGGASFYEVVLGAEPGAGWKPVTHPPWLVICPELLGP